jgi:DNA-binding MarR family transcriptional regulator
MVSPTNSAPEGHAPNSSASGSTSAGGSASDTAAVADEALQAQLDALMGDLQPIISGERSAFAQRCREEGLSTGTLHLMALLDTHGPLAMTQLAEQLGVALPNATGMVDRSHERGMVERLRDPADRRVVHVRLSGPGRSLLRKLELIRRRRMAAALAQMSAEQRTRLLEAIHDLRAAIERADATKETR